jgi:hypothetical protein
MEEIAPRYLLDLHLEVAVGNMTARGRSQDLSTSGIGAYIPRELEIGQFVSILVRNPFKQEDYRLGAVVRNRKGFRYGLEFSNVRTAQQEILEELCNRLGNLSSLKPVSDFDA